MFKITKDHEKIITQVAKLAASKSSMQSLENILIVASDKLNLTSGDGVIEITSIIDTEIKQECSFTVNAAKFLSAVKSCGFECEVIMKQDAIQVKTGRKRFKLSTLDADVYPSYPDQSDYKTIKNAAGKMIGLAKKAMIASGQGDARAMLNGVHIGENIVGTDGHRMIVINDRYDCSIIIPIESIKKIPEIDGDLLISKNIVAFENDEIKIKSRLLDSEYPKYERAISTTSKSVTLNSSDLLDAVKSAMITGESVDLIFGEKSYVKTRGAKADESSIEIDAQGDDVEFSANGKYIIDALGFYEGEITIGFNDRQMIITDQLFTNVVMAVTR